MSDLFCDILIVEDSASLAVACQAYLDTLDLVIDIAMTGQQALDILDQAISPKVILLDLVLPDMNGIHILDKIRSDNLSSKVIVMTAHGSVKTAVEAMQHGALDFILKPFPPERLISAVKNALEVREIHKIVEQNAANQTEGPVGNFIGESPVMQQVYNMIRDAAPSRASVFIIGESGTGKELCATALHDLSPRKSRSFVALNCAAIPENLIESEIFGHVKGAFTGATEDREGAASRANGGTLFLDEICDMPLEFQAKLLRFIQTGQIAPVGSNKINTVDVRFICATNRHPWEAVLAGDFREDLYYRLHVIPIVMPPLRDRKEDIIEIAQLMLTKFSNEEKRGFRHLSQSAETRLRAHSWPGNVRELGNVIQSAVVLHDGESLTGEMIERILGTASSPRQPVEARPVKMPDYLAKNSLMASKPAAHSDYPAYAARADQSVPGPFQSLPPQVSPITSISPGMQADAYSDRLSSEDKNRQDILVGPNDYLGTDDCFISLTDEKATILPFDHIERLVLEKAIRLCDGKVRKAAKHLAINPSTLYRKISNWKKEDNPEK